ncbi:MAG: hypothetical protein IT422_06265 [Pirellulaceae bacterium]|nr:hypothetical protein [Pirellulaceae bacterium]
MSYFSKSAIQTLALPTLVRSCLSTWVFAVTLLANQSSVSADDETTPKAFDYEASVLYPQFSDEQVDNRIEWAENDMVELNKKGSDITDAEVELLRWLRLSAKAFRVIKVERAIAAEQRKKAIEACPSLATQ